MEELRDCPCSGKHLPSLLRPTLLMLLEAGECHGYELIQQVGEACAHGGTPDTGGVYRTLRAMEEEGLLVSFWETSEPGPAKRRYRLTSDGRECLKRWVGSLKTYHTALNRLVEMGESAVREMEEIL